MLGKNIQRYRREKGISQRETAKRCKLSRTTYRDIESGKVKNPTLFNICRLCRGLDVSPNELIPEEYWKNTKGD